MGKKRSRLSFNLILSCLLVLSACDKNKPALTCPDVDCLIRHAENNQAFVKKITEDEKVAYQGFLLAYSKSSSHSSQTSAASQTSTELEQKFDTLFKTSNFIFPERNFSSYILDSKFTVKGMTTLIGHINSTGPFAGQFNHVDVLEIDHLSGYLRTHFQANGDKFASLLIRFSNTHFLPLFLVKGTDTFIAVIADSVGGQDLDYLNDVREAFRDSEMEYVELYSFSPVRQKDKTSCAAFALLDLMENTKVNLLEFIKELKSSRSEHVSSRPEVDVELPRVQWVDHYPPRFMKPTQSRTIINQYLQDFPHYESEIVNTEEVELNLQEFVSGNLENISSDKPKKIKQNTYVLRKYIEFKHRVIEKALTQ